MSLLHERKRLLGRCLKIKCEGLGGPGLVMDLGALLGDFQLFMKIGKRDERRYKEFLTELNSLKLRYNEPILIDACVGYMNREWWKNAD